MPSCLYINKLLITVYYSNWSVKYSTISEKGTRLQLAVDSQGSRSLMMEVDTYALQQLLYHSFVYRQNKAQVTQEHDKNSFIPSDYGIHMLVILTKEPILKHIFITVKKEVNLQ